MNTEIKAETPGESPHLRGGRARRSPSYRLMLGGAAVMAVVVVSAALLGWYTLYRIDREFARLERHYAVSHGTALLLDGALRSDWASHLAEQGLKKEAQRAQREAAEMFHSQLDRVREAGLLPEVRLQTLEHLYEELEQGLAQDRSGGATDAADAKDLLSVQLDLDAFLDEMHVEADRRMVDVWQEQKASVIGTVFMLLVLGVAGMVGCVGAGIWVTRKILRGLENPMHRITRSAEQLNNAAQYQVKSVADQSSATVQISSTMQELLATCRNLIDKSRDMVQTSQEAAEECHKGHTLLTNSQKGMGHIKVEVERITDHMRTLEDKSQQINSVLEIINELASQTNLLSINATIEAAGAGEAGRRFAVVAEEIRLLAERAVESTEEIRALIEDIQETARVTSAVTADGARAVDRGLEDSGKIAENFSALITLVTRTADAVQLIEGTAREQGRSVEQVTAAVESLSHISSESERHSSNTLDTITNLAQVARELQLMAGDPGLQES